MEGPQFSQRFDGSLVAKEQTGRMAQTTSDRLLEERIRKSQLNQEGPIHEEAGTLIVNAGWRPARQLCWRRIQSHLSSQERRLDRIASHTVSAEKGRPSSAPSW